jgi:hypothetical protein
MYWGSSAVSVLVGVVGGVLLVVAIVLGKRLGLRRAAGVSGLGLLLLGLTLSGIIEVLARTFTLNPLRWAGLGAAAIGVLLLSWSGMLPRRERKQGRAQAAGGKGAESGKEVEPGRSDQQGSPAVGDDELADIEEILRRRGIT